MKRSTTALALMAAGVLGLAAAIAAQSAGGTATVPGNVWRPAKPQMPTSIALSPATLMIKVAGAFWISSRDRSIGASR